jgi:hypothetical protein
MRTAAPAPSPSRLPAGLRATLHRCLGCGRPFAYRYEGAYRPDALSAVDFVCRRCFPAWFQAWESAHGWGPALQAEPARFVPPWSVLQGGAPQ